MKPREIESLLRSYVVRVWDEGDVEAAGSFLAPDYRRHLSPSLPPLDVAGQLARLAGFRAAFPDASITVEDVIAVEDRVAFRSVMRGTHRGDFLGVAPTGREVEVGLLDVIRLEDGRFAEHWGGPDLFDLLRQLGGDPKREGGPPWAPPPDTGSAAS